MSPASEFHARLQARRSFRVRAETEEAQVDVEKYVEEIKEKVRLHYLRMYEAHDLQYCSSSLITLTPPPPPFFTTV